jgi:hypothetical protein
MSRNIGRGSAAALLLISLSATSAWADPPESHVLSPSEPVAAHSPTQAVSPFAALAGTWVGGGTIDLTGEIHEKLRCRAIYNYGQSASSLALSIRCASDNYKFELSSRVTERRGAISGQWSEATYNVTGSIIGHAAGNRITAAARSDGLNANLSVTTTGNRQTVTITPQATYVIRVQIALNRR